MLPRGCLGHEVVEGKQEEKKEKGVPPLSEHSECSFLSPESEIEGFSLSPLCELPNTQFYTGQKYWRKTVRSMVLYILVFFLSLPGIS